MAGGEDERAAPFLLFLALMALCFLGGGGSRGDIASLLFLRPAAVLCLFFFLFYARRGELAAVKAPLILLGLFAVLLVIQLIPLPPSIWLSLPGRAPFAEAASLAGIEQPWRPISIAPDLTLNSLAALTVPAAFLAGFAVLSERQRALLLPALLLAVLVSALFAIAQLTAGPESPFYLYDVTNDGSAVGLMSNRNHQAVLLALAYPMLAFWAAVPQKDPRARRFRALTACCLGFFLIPMILVTGSRAGFLLGGGGAIVAVLLYLNEQRLLGAKGGALRLGALAAVGAGAIVVATVSFVFSRSEALTRLLALDVENELRVSSLPTFVQMAKDYFPVGAGTGTFDPVYRIYEPRALLSPEYLNQAHNDLLDVAISSGVLGLALLAAALIWWALRSWRVFTAGRAGGASARYGRLASVAMIMILAFSLVDYPLRTPSLAMFFAICCGWLSAAGRPAKAPLSADE
jgi:O-antigen ligase